MIPSAHSATKALLLERHAMRGLVTEAREEKARLQVAVDDTVRAFRALHEAGFDRMTLLDMLNWLHVSAVAVDHRHNQTIDNAGQDFDWLEVGDLMALEQTVKAGMKGD